MPTPKGIPLYAVPGAVHPKPAGPLKTRKDIPLYAVPGIVPGPSTLNRRGHPKPARPLETLNGIPLYAAPGAVHPKPAGPLQTLKGIFLYVVPGAVHPKPAGPHSWNFLENSSKFYKDSLNFLEIREKLLGIHQFPSYVCPQIGC